ncbi:MAG TPA: DapH/DapD/GlmU-related protein [Terrimicrobiaceae bacterium]|nr:DapH/DapD/GlmU-related protein [Terrimicrobiaceae bacterium]
MKGGILQDWEANAGNWKSRSAMLLYRAAQAVRRQPMPLRLVGLPIIVLYLIYVEWLLGIELNLKSSIGPGLRLYHGTGLVIHEAAVLGRNCALRHCTTIGMKNGPADCPFIGNNVDIGSNSVLLGAIAVGDNAVIGAGSVVLRDVAPGDVVAGNPARSIRKRE